MPEQNEKLAILFDWIKTRRKEGYSIKQVSAYLKKYGYSSGQIEYILAQTTAQIIAESKIQQAPKPAIEKKQLVEDGKSKKNPESFHEDISPENAKAFLLRIHLLIASPRLFFTHLYTSPTMKGLRMISFSVLVALTLGSLFWIGYYASGIFLYAPSWLKIFISPYVTAKIFILFALMLLVFQPLYYFIIHLHSSYLDPKQYFGGLLFSLTPFIMFSTIPFLNILGILLSLHLIDIAFKSYYNASDRSLFDVSVVYALGLGMISLSIALIYATSNVPTTTECILIPNSTSCEVVQTNFNQLTINGLPNSPIIIANSNNNELCYGTSPYDINCDRIIGPGAYYFYGSNFTGAFSIV